MNSFAIGWSRMWTGPMVIAHFFEWVLGWGIWAHQVSEYPPSRTQKSRIGIEGGLYQLFERSSSRYRRRNKDVNLQRRSGDVERRKTKRGPSRSLRMGKHFPNWPSDSDVRHLTTQTIALESLRSVLFVIQKYEYLSNT